MERTIEYVSTTPDVQLGPPKGGSPVRPVDPPRPVLVDLPALYGRQAHFVRPHVLALVNLPTVAGWLDAWVLTDTGWFGSVRYHVRIAGRLVEQAHLVPGWALRPPTDREIHQARMRGELEPR